jgi:hypothetical protein
MIVIKDGPYFNKIYADQAFNEWGLPIAGLKFTQSDQDIRVVEEWTDIDIPDDAIKIDANDPYDVDFNEYYKLIENTLWIFNNEGMKLKENVYMTGAGVNWMFQKGDINIFDISKVQVKFVESLCADWSGTNYGEFVYDFIRKNKIMHFHVNLKERQQSDKELIFNRDEFIDKVNENFEFLKNKYDPDWQWNPSNVKVVNGNLIEQLSKIYLGKAILTNIFNFKYYFAKLYVKDAYSMLAPSTRSFIKQNTHLKVSHDQNPACVKMDLNVPVKDVYDEIQNIRPYLHTHRSDSGIGWESFCIHGQAYNRTKEEKYYPDFWGYKWTPEAIKHMPKTIAWLKSLGYKEFQRVRVMCLMPKGFINLHKDQNHSQLGAVNVAINNPKECKFYLQNHGVLDFRPGDAYKLDLVNYHTIVNNSNIPRYHIIIHGDQE